MVILDGTIVTVALPSIQRDLGFSQEGLMWVVNADLIAFGGLLLLAGRLGDLLGGRRVLLTDLGGFTAASLACGLSGDAATLIAARFAQGVGGAMVSAVSLGMIIELFPDPRERSRAIGVYSAVAAAMFGFQFMIALYLQRVLGYDPLRTGLAMLPTAIVIAACSLGLSARLNARFGPGVVLPAGLAVIVAGFVPLARVPAAGPYTEGPLPAMLLLNVGFGLAMPALTSLAMSDAAPEDSGLLSGLFNTTQQVGGALGLAVLGTLAAARTDRLAARGRPSAEALTGGFHVAFGVAGDLVGAAAVVALIVLRPRPGATLPETRLEPVAVGDRP